jgi:hypothetical protein
VAACLVLVLAVLAGSIGWVERDREARRDDAVRRAGEVLGSADAFVQQENWPEGLRAVEQAEGFLAGFEEETALRLRARQLRRDSVQASDGFVRSGKGGSHTLNCLAVPLSCRDNKSVPGPGVLPCTAYRPLPLSLPWSLSFLLATGNIAARKPATRTKAKKKAKRAGKEAKAKRREAEAKARLEKAKSLLNAGKRNQAIKRLRNIVRRYPGTKASVEAAVILTFSTGEP